MDEITVMGRCSGIMNGWNIHSAFYKFRLERRWYATPGEWRFQAIGGNISQEMNWRWQGG